MHVVPLQHLLGERAELAALDQATCAAGLASREQVLRDRHPREERELLKDHADAVGAGSGCDRVRDVLAVEAHDARLGSDDAAEDLDQRALAGAVLADERVYLAELSGQVACGEGAHAAERTSNVDCLDRRPGLVHGLRICRQA